MTNTQENVSNELDLAQLSSSPISLVKNTSELSEKKLKINPWKLGFIIIIIVAGFIIIGLNTFVDSFKDAFDEWNEQVTIYLLTHPGTAIGIWFGVLIAKSFGVRDFLDLKRNSIVCFIAYFYDLNPKYTLLIALWAHCITATADTISSIIEFKFVGIESQTVNTTFLEWCFIVGWSIIYYIFIFPFKYIILNIFNVYICECITIKSDKWTKCNDNTTKSLTNNDNNNKNNCYSKIGNYLSYDNNVFKLVGKTNLENEMSLIQFLKMSPYFIINNNCFVYIFAIIMLIFNGLSLYADAIFMLFVWKFGYESILIIWGYNQFDAESYLKTWFVADAYLNGGGYTDGFIKTLITNIGGKIFGVFVTYLINIIIFKPTAQLHNTLYDKNKNKNFEIDTDALKNPLHSIKKQNTFENNKIQPMSAIQKQPSEVP